MPTGYTAMIDDNPEMTTEQWIMTGLARAFGICVTLREDDLNLSEEQIKKRILKDGQRDVDWHKKELDKAQKEYSDIQKRTQSEWSELWKKEEYQKDKNNDESADQASKMKKRHDQVRNDIQKVWAFAKIFLTFSGSNRSAPL